MTYGCHSRPPFVDGFAAQDGAYPSGVPRMVIVPFRMSLQCEYRHSELGKVDPACAGCAHRIDPEPETAGSR